MSAQQGYEKASSTRTAFEGEGVQSGWMRGRRREKMGEGGCEADSAHELESERVGGRRAGEPLGTSSREPANSPGGPGCAVQSANAADCERASARGRLERPWRGGAGGLIQASIGVLFEVWLLLRGRRRDFRAAFLQDGAEVAVTSRAPAAGLESRAVRELGERTVGEGRLRTEALISRA